MGRLTVEVRDGYTLTRFPCGAELVASHAVQDGQAETAARCGYESAEALNREHDLTHSLLAHWLGLPWSPTLHDVAIGVRVNELHFVEEDAVLAVQRFARAMGVDLVKLSEAMK